MELEDSKIAYSTCNVQKYRKYRKYSGGQNIRGIKEMFIKLYTYRQIQISLAVFPTYNILKIVLRTLYSN